MKPFTRIAILFAIPVFSFQPATSQSQMLTMEEAVLKQKTSLAPQKLDPIEWITGTDNYYYLRGEKNSKVKSLFTGSFAKGKMIRKVTVSDLNKAIRATSKEEDTLSVFPEISWEGLDNFSFENKKSKFTYTVSAGKATISGKSLPKDWENLDIEQVSGNMAFTKGNNVFVSLKKQAGGNEHEVTKDQNPDIVNGHSVHRDEFGITKGLFWSPAGNILAFYRMDQTMVTDYPILDLTKQPATSRMIKYPMAGAKSHEVTIGLFDTRTKTTVFLNTTGPKDQYLTNIAWSPDEKHIYVAILNRDQNHLWLNVYNATNGAFEKTLFEETDSKYVHPTHPLEFVKGSKDKFVWQSQRSGSNQLYLYSTDGKLIRQLTGTDGEDLEVTQLTGMDPEGKNLFYQSIPKSDPIGRTVRRVGIEDGKSVTLFSGNGTHAAKVSSSGKYLIDIFSSIQTPKVITLTDANGKTVQSLLVADNPLKDYKLGTMKVFTIHGAPGQDLYCRMILPVDFDSTKKYPVIDYLYGGPNVQLITDTWLAGSDLWYQYMAEHGYIVFTLDNRGSSGRGKEFEQATFRHLGSAEMDDQLRGVDYLKSLKYVDASRLGVFGWSFGGFMTTSLMTRHPGVFKVAVAGGPVIDWSYYEVMYTERYMDTPETNKEGYNENNLLNYADKLQGKILIIHGTSDDVVVWQHSLMFLRKCVETGSQPDYFVYPGHLHNVLGKDRVHLFNKITAYFMQNL